MYARFAYKAKARCRSYLRKLVEASSYRMVDWQVVDRQLVDCRRAQ